MARRQYLLSGMSCVLVIILTCSPAFAETIEGTPQKEVDMLKTHQLFANDCFNKCWTIIDKKDKTAEDIENMLLLSYTSLWHWKQLQNCQPLNLSIGYWQISRAHVLAGQYQMARFFADKCLKVGLEKQLPPFYIAYAYEALARAEILNKNKKEAGEYLGKARQLSQQVTAEEEKHLLEADLAVVEKKLAEKPQSSSGK